MTKYLTQTGAVIAILFMNLLFSGSAHAIGKVYLDQTGLDANQVVVTMNMFRTGGTITLNGCDEDNCPAGLSVNKKTRFMAHGQKIKRKDLSNYSGQRAYVKYFKASGAVILIDWK